MAENDLLDQIYAHRKIVANTVNALVSADYLLHHLEDKSFQTSRKAFSKALKNQFNLLSLDEYEDFMFQNRPYWQLYRQLFLRYRNLVQDQEEI